MKGTQVPPSFDLSKANANRIQHETRATIDPIVTIVQRGSTRVAFLISAIALQAGTFASRYAGKIGQEVKSVQMITFGHVISNYTFTGQPLVSDELANLRTWAESNDLELAENESLGFIADVQLEVGTKNVAKGEAKVEAFWKSEAIPSNKVKNVTTNQESVKLDSTILGELKNLGSTVLSVAVTDSAWAPMLDSVPNGGWLSEKNLGQNKDQSESTDTAAELAKKAAAQAGASASNDPASDAAGL